MPRPHPLAWTCALSLWTVALHAGDVPLPGPVASPGTAVIAADWQAELLADKKQPASGRVEASADGVKLITTEQPPEIYNLQAQLRNRIALHRGDTLFIRFAARSLQADKFTGVTKLRAAFSKASPGWDRSYSGELGLGAGWERFDLPFTCKNDFAPGEAMLSFTFGFPPQALELADVQVLRYGPEVAVSSLPRTRRFADKVPAETVDREFARIAAMRRELDAVKDPAPANGKILLVATNGAADGDGSAEHPFATIPQALAHAQPGDTVRVGAGEYREPGGVSVRVSGRPDAWIHIEAAPGARPKLVTSSWSGFELRGGIAYVEIKGFELQWLPLPAGNGEQGKTVHGVGLAPMYASHHLRFLDNVIHGYGTGGICALDCDYMYLEGNLIYDCCKTSPYGGSAISLCRAFNSDEFPGYHNVVRGNICHDNELRIATTANSGGNGRVLTDGNGIIIDVFLRSRANPLKPHHLDRDGPLLPYRHRTLIENNLVYDNGGRGVHVFRSAQVDVVNNTCYMNQKSADINAGELTAIEGSEVVFLNNIAYGRPDKRGNTQDGSSRVIWRDNLFANCDDVLVHDGLIEADPRFVAPATDAGPEAFRLRADSPALGKGLAAAPPRDLRGTPRAVEGPVDLGAFQESR